MLSSTLSRSSFAAFGATLLLIALSTSPAFAQREAQAEELFRAGVALAKAQDFRAAIGKFSASYRIDPAAGTLVALAVAEESAGLTATALGHYQRLVDELTDKATSDEARERLAFAQKRVEVLTPQVPRLELSSDQPLPNNAVVRVNGTPVPIAALGTALPVDPGTTRVLVEAPGYRAFAAEFKLVAAERRKLRLHLQLLPAKRSPLRPPASAARSSVGPKRASKKPIAVDQTWFSPVHVTGLVLTAFGAGATGFGVFGYVTAGERHSELSSRCQAGCSSDQIAQAKKDADAAQLIERLGVAGLIAGGVLAVGGITLLVLPTPSHNVGLEVGPLSLRLTRRF